MNQALKTIQDLLQQNKQLTEPEKELFQKAISDADKQWSITEFKLDRTEKVKRTTAILLEETIEELEHKRKAVEVQNRELEIEAALERVRARAMAMQKSDELTDVATLLFKQVNDLGIKTWTTGFNVWSDDDTSWMDYVTNPQGGFIKPYTKDATLYPLNEVREAKKRGDEFFVRCEEGEQLAETYRQLSTFGENQYKAIMDSGFQFPTKQYEHFVFCSKVSLMFITYDPVPEAHEIFKRFGRVFEQTYTRFLDLQKAEAQARESQIQLALERVRARTMAMYNSHELHEVAEVLFQQLLSFGGNILNAGIALCRPDADEDEFWVSSETGIRPIISIPHTEDSTQRNLYEGWKNNLESYSESKGGDELKAHYKYMLSVPSLKPFFEVESASNRSFPTWQKWHAAYFSHGYLFLLTADEYDEEKILVKFAKVFEQAYIRFFDLQKAEASAMVALRQASVDRVRGEIASMRTTKDLERITPLIWNELTILAIPFTRCGVFILNEKEQQCHIYLSTPDGKAIAAFNLPFSSDSRFIEGVLNHWRDKQMFIDHWDAERFTEWAHSLVTAGMIQVNEQYSTETPPENLYLHFVPFMQGMLYVGNTELLSEEQLLLVQSLAGAFATAYARYEDFKKLETAKQQIETTLSDLKSTQAQLIQSEKMASLGELTAGIAHEIQNPLNFVNNFSETNNELLAELKDEMIKGNVKEVQALANDVIENNVKINHHGKRADSIVKGMLEHSRSSNGQKEPTDINKLVDEYLRLAYHGFRAKDKSFECQIETHFDNSISKVNIIPQEIGRVLLNLFNNAFYAVREKANNMSEGYEPAVTVRTEKQNNKIELSVQDNGMGIPSNIVDKIFQPFFTTKPTGQGTGLGLSLSYDIVKAQGGELKVESTEGEGAIFTIMLPFS